MMEVPTIIKTWVDTDGVTVYTVQYEDGRTCDMTVQQYDYLKASAQAVADLDAKAAAESQPPETPAPAESAQNITESPDLRDGYVPREEELPFEGVLLITCSVSYSKALTCFTDLGMVYHLARPALRTVLTSSCPPSGRCSIAMQER